MSTNRREVCLEVYVNGEFYCTDSIWVPDEEDTQLEFMVTDAIYDQLEVDTDECMSVSHCALEGDDVHVDTDMKRPTCTCKTPENSPTDASVPESDPELDLVDTKELCVPVPSVPDSESESDLVDSDESCVPGPSVPDSESESDLVDSDESCVSGPSTSEQELFPEEHCFQLEKRVKGCTQHHGPVTAVWNNIFIGN